MIPAEEDFKLIHAYSEEDLIDKLKLLKLSGPWEPVGVRTIIGLKDVKLIWIQAMVRNKPT